MITGFTILNVEGKINSSDALSKQRFPRLNINIDGVSAEGTKLSVNYSFQADYHDGEAKDAKNVGHIKLSGLVEVTESKDEVANVIKKWNQDHVLPVQLAEEIINGLNFRCSATGTLVAYSLGLIPPLVISTTRIQEQKPVTP
ncbi:MAG: hypothetical protein ACREBH_02935 [Candidatus Micrarchaeaceae archaeon]